MTVDVVDPSKAIESVAKLLKGCNNVRLSNAAVDDLPFDDNTSIFYLAWVFYIVYQILNLR